MASLGGYGSGSVPSHSVVSYKNVTLQNLLPKRYHSHCIGNQKLWRLPPVNVTNEGKEVQVKKLIQEHGLDDDEYIVVDPQNPVPNPELGPLERRVSITFEEGLAMEEVDQEAMNYWFTEPAQGWATGKSKLKKTKSIPLEDDIDDFRKVDSSVGERKVLDDLNKGDLLCGIVTEQLLHHGLRVDVNAEADALIPIKGVDLWRNLERRGLVPEIGQSIEVEVHAIRSDPVFRFPLQVIPRNEALASSIPPPEAHKPPLDLRDVPVSRYDEIAKMSGRDWGHQKVLVTPADLDINDAFGAEDDIEITEEELQIYDSVLASLEL